MAFTIDPTTGALTLVPGFAFLANPGCRQPDLNVDGTGNYLYATEGIHDGRRVRLSRSIRTPELYPHSRKPVRFRRSTIQVDPAGTFFLTVASGGSSIEVVSD